MTELPALFSARWQRDEQNQEELTAQFYQKIGQLKVERDWLKKQQDFALSVEERRPLTDTCGKVVPLAGPVSLQLLLPGWTIKPGTPPGAGSGLADHVSVGRAIYEGKEIALPV